MRLGGGEHSLFPCYPPRICVCPLQAAFISPLSFPPPPTLVYPFPAGWQHIGKGMGGKGAGIWTRIFT